MGTSLLFAVPPLAFVLAVVVVFESGVSVFTILTLLFGLVVMTVVLAVDFRAVVLTCMVGLEVDVVELDNVGSLNTCGLLTVFTSTRSLPGSTLILWNVIAEVSGNGNVIFDGATFCNVVKCTLPSDAFN